jgi:hypothetical protein
MNKKYGFLLLAALILGAAFFFLSKSSQGPRKASVSETEPVVKEETIEAAPKSEEASAGPDVAQLPTLEDLSALSEEEVHHTPKIIIEGAGTIAEAIEEADSNPSLRKDTLQFLKSCAEKEDVAVSIRALCWRETLRKIPEWKVFVSISDAKVSEDVKDLAAKLP